MKTKLSTKQEIFCLSLFQGMNQTEAYEKAGYLSKYPRSVASRMSTKVNIVSRIQELQREAKDALIADVIERKEILTEIARGRLTDFVQCGPDGASISVELGNLHSAALKEVESTTVYPTRASSESKEANDTAAVITKLKLHSPIPAIAELNKMEQIGQPNIPVSGEIVLRVIYDSGNRIQGQAEESPPEAERVYRLSSKTEDS